MYKRFLDISAILKKKSLLLLGPRQTGKSTLALGLGDAIEYLDLAENNTYRELSARPELLRQRLSERKRTLVIDEAQKLPELFDEVQVLLDRNKDLRVLLTGSSARKLRRTGFNLLPGRIWRKNLFPLVSAELGAARIDDRVSRGSLPGVIDSEDFRTTAALGNAEQLNYTNIANDTGMPLNTVKGYYQILYDTLIGYELPPYRKTKTRKAVATPKFYFFDIGVVNELLGRFEIERHGDLFGKAFEHLIFAELKAALDYFDSDRPLSYWRSLSKFEVDFLLGDDIAIEVKGKSVVSPRDERSLSALAEGLLAGS